MTTRKQIKIQLEAYMASDFNPTVEKAVEASILNIIKASTEVAA